MKKYCQKCNKVFDEQKKYCPYCGNQLIEKEENNATEKKETTQEITSEDENMWENLKKDKLLPFYDPIARRFLLPLTVVLGILEVLFFWWFCVKGIPDALNNSWIKLIFFLAVYAGLANLRQWTICEYAGNPEIQMFGITENIFLSLETTMKIIYIVIYIVCVAYCLNYLMDVWGITVNLIENLFENADHNIIKENLMIMYKLKNCMMVSLFTSIIYEESMLHHKVEKEDMEISGLFLKMFHTIKNHLSTLK